MAGYVQEPTKDVVDVRELFDTRICLGVTAASHVDMALGDGARDRGALADEIPGDPDHAGIGFVIDTGSRLPVRFRAGWVTDADIDDLAARCAPRPAGLTPLRERGIGTSCAPLTRTAPTRQGGACMRDSPAPRPPHRRYRPSCRHRSPAWHARPPCSPPRSSSTGHPVGLGRSSGWPCSLADAAPGGPAGAGAPRGRRRRPRGRGLRGGPSTCPTARPPDAARDCRAGVA